MPFHARYGTLPLGEDQMEYIRFGTGPRALVMLPGLGDSLRSLKGTELPMALMYRCFAKDFTVYCFSRRKTVPQGYTTRDMARDQAQAMAALGIGNADVFGVSMGGMIAQWLAIDHPERVGKLILAVTCPCPNPLLRDSVGEWIVLARKGDHAAFMESNLRRIYSRKYYRQNRWMIPLLGLFTKPKSYEQFFRQAEACLNHYAIDQLGRISAPTLVVGGEQDRALGGEPSYLIADEIPGASLRMYPQWGHGLYEEAKDFNDLLLDFLKT